MTRLWLLPYRSFEEIKENVSKGTYSDYQPIADALVELGLLNADDYDEPELLKAAYDYVNGKGGLRRLDPKIIDWAEDNPGRLVLADINADDFLTSVSYTDNGSYETVYFKVDGDHFQFNGLTLITSEDKLKIY